MSGEKAVTKYTRLAVERHVNDLKKSEDDPDYPYYFDEKEADRAIEITELHRHTKGRRFAGKHFVLMPWQAFVKACVYGWKKRKNGFRKYTVVYLEIPRKNGKSTDRAVDASIGLIFDREPGAEIYTAATKRDQARIVFDIAHDMIEKLVEDIPDLKDIVTLQNHNVHIQSTKSKMQPVSSEAKTNDGTNPSMGFVDEYGAHKNDGVKKSLETGMVGRDQPLLWLFTTAYANMGGPCYQYRKGVMNVLDGMMEDEGTFGLICSADADDDWHDPKVWAKVNLGYPVQPTHEALERAYKAAQYGAAAELHFKTKHLNIWMRNSIKYISDEIWQKNVGVIDMEALKGRKCWAGLDMSRVVDLTSLVLFFPKEKPNDKHVILMYNWCPEDTIEKRSNEESNDYLQWERDGLIYAIPGKVIKDEYVEAKIIELNKLYSLITLEYDPRYAHQLVSKLEVAGITCSAFSQSSREFTSPIKKLESLAIEEELNHGGNEILRWMNSNVELKTYPNDGLMFDKEKSIDKIDGMVALAQAIGGWETDKDDHGPSKYEDEDIVVFNF